MRTKFRKLVIVKRYFWGSMAIALVPFLLLAGFYDRYTSDLYESLLKGKLEAEVQSSVARIDNFIDVQSKRLENLSDLPEIAAVFGQTPNSVLPSSLLDFLYLEVGDADVYNIGFYDTSGEHLRSFPDMSPPLQGILVHSGGVQGLVIEEPHIPSNGRPGWFFMHKPLVRQGGMVGTIALRLRLASLTEQTSSLYRTGVYEGVVLTPGGNIFSAVGNTTKAGKFIAKSAPFLTGWAVGLRQSGEIINDPGIRLWFLLAAAASMLGVALLFFSLSERLASMIGPITEGAQAVANGDFTTRVPESAPGELGMLARSFNDMSGQLTKLVSSRVDTERRANLGNLATGIAHEIRNPLAIIRTTIHGLIRSEDDVQRQQMLEAVNEEIVRTDAIVEEFMNYARPRVPKREHVKLDDVVENAVTLMSASAHEVGVDIGVSGEKRLNVYVDAGQLQQVIMNIFINAIDAMPNGGHLHVRTAPFDSQASLYISDTGTGMSADEVEHAQQPFYTRKQNGTGLGLAICSQLLAVNDGHMLIKSPPQRGVTVIVTLPLSDRVPGKTNNES